MHPATPTAPSFISKRTTKLAGRIDSRMGNVLCWSNFAGPDHINLEPKYTSMAGTEYVNHDRFVPSLGEITATSPWG